MTRGNKMKQTVSYYGFVDTFMSIRPENFSRQALTAMFEYFEEYEDSSGEEMELDVVAICCDFSEYDSAIAAAREMSDFEPDAQRDDFTSDEEDEYLECLEKEAMEYLENHTTVIRFDGGIVVASF